MLSWGDVIKGYLLEYFQTNKGSASSLIVWDAMKEYLRGRLIKEISRLKKAVREWEFFFSRYGIYLADKESYLSTPSAQSFRSWKDAQMVYKQKSFEKAESKKCFSSCQYFADGENTAYMLAVIASSQSPSNSILTVYSTSGPVTQNSAEILGAFHSFYSNLYSSKVKYEMQ